MNKAKVYCVASAVAVCVASNPSVDVLAKHVQPVKLEEKANYLSVLTGNNLFKDLTSENQDQIKAAYETAYTDAGMKKEDGCTLSAYEIVVNEANKLVANAKNALELSLKDAKSLDAKNFTSDSYAVLKACIDEADALVVLPEVTIEQFSNEQVNLENAKKALVNIQA